MTREELNSKREKLQEKQRELEKAVKIDKKLTKLDAQIETLAKTKTVQLKVDDNVTNGVWNTSINENPELIKGIVDLVITSLRVKAAVLEGELGKLDI